MNRPEILDAARSCVCGAREQDYGTPEDNFTTIAMFWRTYLMAAHPADPVIKLTPDCITGSLTPYNITAKDVAVMMALLKVARIATGSSPDSFVDLAGYAACAGEIATMPNTEPEVPC